MTYILWKNSYSVQVETFDNQHKQLISIINELQKADEEGKSNEAIEEIIEELVAYTIYHFKHEEAYFKRHNYTESKEHKAEHEQFINEINQFKQRYKSGKMYLSEDVLKYLKSWLMRHILGSDQKYGAFFKEKQIL
jgi:hemerythrin